MTETRPRILVTGAGGFVGCWVLAGLAGRAEIVPADVHGRRADLLTVADRRALIRAARADVLIHLAWVTEHGKFWHSDMNLAWEAASQDLFREFYAAGGRRIVGVGTCAEYDWTTGAARFAEDAPLAPHTPYGAAKARTAEALADAADRAGASWAWGRVFFSFGPGEPPTRLIPLMLQAVRLGAPLGIGPGDTERDFWHVRHLGAALAELALSTVEGPINAASGRGARFAALADLVNDLGAGSPIAPDRRALGPGEPRVLVADAGRLEREVGYRPPDSLAGDLADYAQYLEGAATASATASRHG